MKVFKEQPLRNCYDRETKMVGVIEKYLIPMVD